MTPPHASREHWLSVLACADVEEVSEAWRALPFVPDFFWLRKPERGAILVRGRVGGDGAPFNFGEMTVTRCAIQIVGGPIGLGYVPGCNKRHAMMTAVLDAALQAPGPLADSAAPIVSRLADLADQRRRRLAGAVRASSVNFTMSVRA